MQVPCSKPREAYGLRLESQDVHTALCRTALEEPYVRYTAKTTRFGELTGKRIDALLRSLSARLDIWETVYLHRLYGYQGLLDWYRGTGLRPYLEALPDPLREPFEQAFLDKIRQRYPLEPDGSLLFWFRRFFFVAYKKSYKGE